MFTGLVEEVGGVQSVRAQNGGLRLTISSRKVAADVSVDASIAIDGVCLTVVSHDRSSFDVVAVGETLRKTTLGGLREGSKVNLERALRPTDRLGGHFVQGHVDGVGSVAGWAPQEGGRLLTLELPVPLMKYVIGEGSIAVDGVSLTVARISGKRITISLIPHTLEKTTLAMKGVGDTVNIETDLLGKYVERLLTAASGSGRISSQWLKELGYGKTSV